MFINFFRKLWYFRRYMRLYKANKILKKAADNKVKERQQLMKEIMAEIRSFLGVGKDDMSIYIPYDYKTRVRTKEHIYTKFGERMAKHKVTLTTQLKLV